MRRWRELLDDSHPEGWRQFHNHYPGPPDDPGYWSGTTLHPWFNFWSADESYSGEQRCYCGCFEGRGREHFSTGSFVDENGVRQGDPPSALRNPYRRWVTRAARASVAVRNADALQAAYAERMAGLTAEELAAEVSELAVRALGALHASDRRERRNPLRRP